MLQAILGALIVLSLLFDRCNVLGIDEDNGNNNNRPILRQEGIGSQRQRTASRANINTSALRDVARLYLCLMYSIFVGCHVFYNVSVWSSSIVAAATLVAIHLCVRGNAAKLVAHAALAILHLA